MHGQFCWYDLMTPDSSVAKRFYPSVTGWGTEEWDKANYSMWTAGGVPVGGMSPITPEQTAEGIPPHWIAYVIVDSVENAADKVKSLGGKVLHGPEVTPEAGRFAIIEDPQGAMLAIIQPATPGPGYDGTPSLGKFTWHELMTSDHQAAFKFYRQLFGWEKTGEMDTGPAGKYLFYGMKGKPFGGIYNREAERAHVPPNWLFYANVKDVDKAAVAAKNVGGTIVVGPLDVTPGGDRIAVGIDPQGAHFAVHQTRAQTAAKSKAKAKAKPKGKPKAKAKARKKPKPKARSRPKATSKKKKAARKVRRR